MDKKDSGKVALYHDDSESGSRLVLLCDGLAVESQVSQLCVCNASLLPMLMHNVLLRMRSSFSIDIQNVLITCLNVQKNISIFSVQAEL